MESGENFWKGQSTCGNGKFGTWGKGEAELEAVSSTQHNYRLIARELLQLLFYFLGG